MDEIATIRFLRLQCRLILSHMLLNVNRFVTLLKTTSYTTFLPYKIEIKIPLQMYLIQPPQ